MKKFLLFLSLTLCLLASVAVKTLGQTPEPPQTYAIWSPDGQALAIASPTQFLIYHPGQTEPLEISAGGHIDAATFSSDGTRLAVWSDETEVISIWDAMTGEYIAQRNYAAGMGAVRWIRFAREDQVLAFYYVDFTWAIGGKRIASHVLRQDQLNDITPTPIPTLISFTNGVYLWDYETDAEPQVVRLASNPSESALALSPDATELVSVRYDSQMRTGFLITSSRVTRIQSGEIIGYLGGFTTRLRQVAFNPVNSSFVAALSEDGIVRISGVAQQIQPFSFTLLRNRILTIAYNPDGTQLATGGVDGKVRLWDAETGAMLDVYANQLADVYQLEFTDAGDLLAFGDPLNYPRVWDARTLATISDFRVLLSEAQAS